MSNLRREPGPFFVFVLFSFFATLTMSSIFRTIAAGSRTLAQALAPAAIFILALIIYTGFTIPTSNMKPWFRWLNYLNPIAYAFESLMINEFHNRNFPCTSFIPSGSKYDNVTGLQRTCSTVGSVAGSGIVRGDDYIGQSFHYYAVNMWRYVLAALNCWYAKNFCRNLGIIIAIMFGFTGLYLVATDLIQAAKSKGEVLVFRRGYIPTHMKSAKGEDDEEKAVGDKMFQRSSFGEATHETATLAAIHRQTKIFHWKDVCYDIKIKGTPRRLLDHVDGWVKPGTLTALMVLKIFLVL